MTDDDNLFSKGCQLFDAEEYFDAHEVWEELWNEADGARRHYLQGLIQIAAALHHANNKNWNGVRKLFASALVYLEKGQSEAAEIDLVLLKDHVLDFENALQALLKGEDGALPFFKLPRRS